MSNVNGRRTGLKPCPHCGSQDRDSNGQCRCRNALYRLTKTHRPVEDGCLCTWRGKSHAAHLRAVVKKAAQ